MHHIWRILASLASEILSCSRHLQVYEKEFYPLIQVSNCTHTQMDCFQGLSVQEKAQIRSEIQGVIYFILGEKGISSLANS